MAHCEINRYKCDICGKIQDKPDIYPILGWFFVMKNGDETAKIEEERWDVCSLNCLRLLVSHLEVKDGS